MAAAARVALALMLVTALAVACAAKKELLYVHFLDSEEAVVFKPLSSANLVVSTFGTGTVFDNTVTAEASIESKVVARAQGLYYYGSNKKTLETFPEQFNILFLDPKTGAYTGTSFTFFGVWVIGSVLEFFIEGGTGQLRGIKGSVILTAIGDSVDGVYGVDGAVYAIDVQSKRFKSFLAKTY